MPLQVQEHALERASSDTWRYAAIRSEAHRGRVELLWGFEGPTVSPLKRVFPNGCFELLLNYDAPYSVEGQELRQAWVSGLRLEPMVIQQPLRQRCLGARLRPGGARALFGRPLHELTSRSVDLHDLLGTSCRVGIRWAMARPSTTVRAADPGPPACHFFPSRAPASWLSMGMDTTTLPPPLQLYHLATAHYVSQALYVAAALGIADELVERPRDVDALATATDVHAPSGGGEGALLVEVLRANPELTGAVFDLPRLEARATSHITAAGLDSRYRFAGGDFFQAVPEGYDAYLLKHVIHDWDDSRAQAILRCVRDAAGSDAKLLLLEGVYPSRIDTSLGSCSAAKNDCNMMVATGGRQRSEEEFRALFEAIGFRLSRVMQTPTGTTIIEGVPA